MIKRAYVFGLVGVLVGASAVGFVACSSSSDSGGGPGVTTDSGSSGETTPTDSIVPPTDSTATTDSGTLGDTGSSETTPPDDTGTTEGGSTDCGADPTLHPPTIDGGVSSGVFCPGAGAGGKSTTCAAGQICCELATKTGTPASSCIAAGGTCPTSGSPQLTWQCDAPGMCASGSVCCGVGTIHVRTSCTYEEIFPTSTAGAAGSKCETGTACAAGEFIICEAPGDCPTGKTCTPIKAAGKQIGYCK